MSHDRGDIGVDARLCRALASAPDSRVEPPAALDEAILRAAHAALPKPAAGSTSRESHGLFASLKRWWAHPVAAPVFAVLALSTVIVSMWTRHGVPSPTSDDDASPVAAAPARELAKGSRPTTAGGADAAMVQPAAAAAPPAPTAVPTAPTADALSALIAESRKSAVAEREQAPVEAKNVAPNPTPAPKASPRPNQTRRESADLRRLADKTSDPAPAPKETAARARQQAAAARHDVERDEPAVTAQASSELAAAAAPAPAPASPSPPPATTRSADEGRAATGTMAPTDRSASAPTAGRAATVGSVASNLARPATVAPSVGAALGARAVADAPPLARALESGATWQWRADASQPLVAIDDRERAWLARLIAASQGRWMRADPVPPVSLRSPPPAGPGPTWERPGVGPEAKAQHSPNARRFEVWREHAPWATIVVGQSDVTWIDASGGGWRAPLEPDVLAALRRW